jgi:hypothetical protein
MICNIAVSLLLAQEYFLCPETKGWKQMLLKVRITRINSFKSPSGKMGRQIDFTEEQAAQQPIFASVEPDQNQPTGDFATMMGPLMKGLQGMFPVVLPRMSLWLLEEEVEELGIPLEVNRTYNMEIVGGRINLKPVDAQ